MAEDSRVPGVGDREDRHAPTLVTGLQGGRVVHVAAGECHTICSTADGSVFTWGGGEHGKLGLGEEEEGDTLLPTLVRGELQGKQVVQVAAGDYHLACVASRLKIARCIRGETMMMTNWVRMMWMVQTYRCWCERWTLVQM